ncbi:hypothetical protein ATANTOWER_022305 [Ataeniobius toweri]|uniref:Uncharacterized protein n=1 Tax=Ataeniobius toweri TaxID=208326 RepID=A0ABU7B8Z2_9TELE|nr:hypothetical protein [Ataeniobius toweri]
MPDSAPRSIWVIRITDFWRKVFYYRGLRSQTPVSSSGKESSWQLPVFPSSGPRHKHTLSTLQPKSLNPELLTVLRKSLKQPLPPRRLHCSCILAIYQFQVI